MSSRTPSRASSHRTLSLTETNITSEEDQLDAVERLGTLLGTPKAKTASAAGSGGATGEA